jgi:hypothetical protein
MGLLARRRRGLRFEADGIEAPMLALNVGHGSPARPLQSAQDDGNTP